MKRAAPYTNLNENSYVASQTQHISAQRMQQSSRMNSIPGRPDSFPVVEEHSYASVKAEGQWQWDRDAQQMSPTLYREGQVGDSGRSFFQDQISDPKSGSKRRA
ncbi:hypothetical protein Nepgr_009701 [Nepenthes gracilis]|uniref:Uncharacterized protein n=1 Tax=Nepenthes gracilis TaxID=150966 RepID=A0AAD3XKN5_NEPGR|nr:hypothetical protein Nepgr_009701 [Nepenthes gracilis]